MEGSLQSIKAKIDIYIQESISPFISLDGKIVSLEINTVFFFFFFNYRLLRVCPILDNLITDWNYILSSFQHDSFDFFFYYVTREKFYLDQQVRWRSIWDRNRDRIFESNILRIEKKKKIKKNFSILGKSIENFPSELKKYSVAVCNFYHMRNEGNQSA